MLSYLPIVSKKIMIPAAILDVHNLLSKTLYDSIKSSEMIGDIENCNRWIEKKVDSVVNNIKITTFFS